MKRIYWILVLTLLLINLNGLQGFPIPKNKDNDFFSGININRKVGGTMEYSLGVNREYIKVSQREFKDKKGLTNIVQQSVKENMEYKEKGRGYIS